MGFLASPANPRRPVSPSSPALSRRDLLRIGVLGMGASALSLPRLLGAEAPGKAPTPVRAVILLLHYGGPSHLDMWDPKPDAPREIRGEFDAIATSLPGLRITDRLPLTARLTDRLTVIRSMTHAVANHNPAVYQTLTGRTSTRDVALIGAAPADWPALGSVVAKLRPGKASLPDFVSLPHIVTEGVLKCPGQFGGMLGKAFDPLVLERDPSEPDFAVPELTLPADLSAARLGDRRTLHHLLDDQVRAIDGAAAARGMDASYQPRLQPLDLPGGAACLRPPGRRPEDARPLRPAQVGPELPPGAAADRGGRPVRHLLQRAESQRQGRLGHPHRELPPPEAALPSRGPGILGLARRPRRTRPPRLDPRHLGGRVRPQASNRQAGCCRQRHPDRPRPLAAMLHDRPRRRRHPPRPHSRRQRRDRRLSHVATPSAPPTSPPRCSGPSASTPRPPSRTSSASRSPSPRAASCPRSSR